MLGRPFSDLGVQMPLTRETLSDDQLIRHLLGILPEEDARRVEEARPAKAEAHSRNSARGEST